MHLPKYLLILKGPIWISWGGGVPNSLSQSSGENTHRLIGHEFLITTPSELCIRLHAQNPSVHPHNVN